MISKDLCLFPFCKLIVVRCGRNENYSRSINTAHSSLLTTFGYFAISTYNSYLPPIFGTNTLIWGYFLNVRKDRFRSHSDQNKGLSRLNFETSIFCNHFWKFGCQPQKSKADLCMTNGSKDLIYLSFLSVPQRLALVSNAKRKITNFVY